MRKEIGIIGLGKMGGGLALRLKEKGWKVVVFNRTPETTKKYAAQGLTPAYSVNELVSKLRSPKVIWLMVPSGKPVDDMIFSRDGLIKLLKKGDTIIDGGNSFFDNAKARYKKLKNKGISFMDVGTSGGPKGARSGACLMIGGQEEDFRRNEPLFRDLAAPGAYAFFKGPGAGHFVKMVHNGIEYGMMQALAEGFAVLKKSPYHLNLKRAGDIYNHRSVIESRLVGWLNNAFKEFGVDLKGVDGAVGYTGEGEWTVKIAKKLQVVVPILEESFKFRVRSQKNPSYTGKLLTAMRNQFGGHAIKKAPIRH